MINVGESLVESVEVPGESGVAAKRRASSPRARISEALAGPMPGSSQSSVAVAETMARREPKRVSSCRDRSSALLPLPACPLRRIKASNSVSLSVAEPLERSFSRGRSATGQSLMQDIVPSHVQFITSAINKKLQNTIKLRGCKSHCRCSFPTGFFQFDLWPKKDFYTSLRGTTYQRIDR